MIAACAAFGANAPNGADEGGLSDVKRQVLVAVGAGIAGFDERHNFGAGARGEPQSSRRLRLVRNLRIGDRWRVWRLQQAGKRLLGGAVAHAPQPRGPMQNA